MTNETSSPSIFVPGENCWRTAQASRLALIVDAAEYFRILRKVMIGAKRELLLIGWDFDFAIEMLPGDGDADGLAPDGLPNQLGDFIEAVVERNADLKIYILKWNGAVVLAPGQALSMLELRAFASDRINFALDGHHPFGACHHQKIVVADDGLAFCGGIDATEDRWDTSEHLPDNPRRLRTDGSPAMPWHDATTALSGEIAWTLGELARRRWARATGDELERPPESAFDLWPDDLPVAARDVTVAIARTEPPFDGEELVNEIERLCLDVIAAAKDVIYIESQYFAAETVCRALEDRLGEPDGPEIVIVNPESAMSELEDDAMHVLRGRMIERLDAADPGDRFRIFHPATEAGGPIYVHAKVLIADDRVLRIGSSNLNDRSLGFDTECDVAFEGDGDTAEVIEDFRTRLLAEHLGTSPEAVRQAQSEAGSVIGAIDRLNDPDGRGLRPIQRKPEDFMGRLLADTRFFDARYYVGQATSAGRGFRPRYVGLVLGAAGLGALGWWAARRWLRSR